MGRAVFSLADLRRWNRTELALGVAGFPVGHSVSPVMHNAALAQCPELKDWRYFAFELRPEELPEALGLMARAPFRGLNLTVPLKTVVYELVRDRDGSAEAVRAANTLLFERPGSGAPPTAFSTDGEGLLRALEEDFGWKPEGTTGSGVLLLGAGGAGQSAAACLDRAGANVFWYNRTADKVTRLIGELGLRRTRAVAADEIKRLRADLIINATSLGLKAGDPAPLELEQTGTAGARLACDMVYNPPQTAFLEQAGRLGLKTANGLSMLLYQGVRSFEIWTKRQAPVRVMRDVLKEAVYERTS